MIVDWIRWIGPACLFESGIISPICFRKNQTKSIETCHDMQARPWRSLEVRKQDMAESRNSQSVLRVLSLLWRQWCCEYIIYIIIIIENEMWWWKVMIWPYDMMMKMMRGRIVPTMWIWVGFHRSGSFTINNHNDTEWLRFCSAWVGMNACKCSGYA